MPHRQREVSLKSLLIVEMMFLVGFATACTTTSSASNPNPGSNASTSTVSTPRPTSTPTPSPTPTVDRHGLPANVPLPNNVVFKSQGTMVR